MSGNSLVTDDLVLEEVAEPDLDALVAVRTSNPDRLARTEGTDAGAGRYDREMLERDLAVVAFLPGRSFLSVRRRADGRIVGYVDLLDAHPKDGLPWLGAVEIAAADQGRGYGRQCVEAVARRARESLGAEALRAALDSEDPAIAFLQRQGFVVISNAERSSPRGRVEVLVLELRFGEVTATR